MGNKMGSCETKKTKGETRSIKYTTKAEKESEILLLLLLFFNTTKLKSLLAFWVISYNVFDNDFVLIFNFYINIWFFYRKKNQL